MSLPTAQTVEIEWDGSTFTDVTTYLEQRYPVEAHFGRMSATGDVESATLTFTLDNRDGRFTPGNPAGAYWPNVVKGKRVRWKVTGGDATTRTEFVGYVQGFEPSFDDGGVSGAVVTVTAADRFTVATRPFLDNAVEGQRYEANVGQGADIWAFTDRDGATSLRNDGVKTDLLPGLVIPPVRTSTTAVVEGGTANLTAPDGGLACAGMMSFRPSGGVGPVLLLQSTVGADLESIQFWHRTTEVPASYTILARGYGEDLELRWELRLVAHSGQTDLELWNASALYEGTVVYGVNDGMWRHLWAADDAGGTNDIWYAGIDTQVNTYGSYGPWTVSFFDTRWIVIGGGMAPNGRGRQHHCTTSDVAQVMASTATAFGWASSSIPTLGRGAEQRAQDYASAAFGSPASVTVTGTTNHSVGIPDVYGSTVLQVYQELARTVGGVAWVQPGGTVEFRQPDQCRPSSPVLTVDVEADADGGLSLASGVDTRPTRVSVTSPAGDVTVVAATEDAVVVEASLDTCAGDVGQARRAGELLLVGDDTLRVPRVTVNLATSAADVWDEVYALYPSARVRLSGLPSAVLGWTYADYFVVGWTKRTVASADGGSDGFWVDLDLEPAWMVAEVATARVAAGSGAMTATAGTISGTSTGTLVVTTVSGPTLSTDAGDYPRDFSWSGERVTVAAPPGGASSPQTITVTVRGVAPSVARTHGSGEPFDVWNPGAAGI